MKGVKMLGGVNYERITPEGLAVSATGRRARQPELLAVDTVVLCAGQEPERGLADELAAAGIAAPCDRRGGCGGGTGCQARD